MPHYTATRTLLASLEDVWAFLVEPYHLSDWWPGIAGVQPDRRGLAPGARWQLRTGEPQGFALSLLRRPGAAGTLLVTEVERGRRIAFQLAADRIDAELDLESSAPDRTQVTLTVHAPWGAVTRSFPQRALVRLYDLVQTAAS